MKRPTDLPCDPAEWWSCLLVFSYLTGWRVGQVLALRRDQIDLDKRTAKAFAEDTKGKRDALVELHPVVVDHLKAVLSFHELVFFWPHHPRTLWSDFAKLKETAGVKFSGAFHRLRFGFATMNRGRYDGKVLQRLMLHKSYQTTLRYINVETEVARTADRLFVPDLPPKKSAAG
jgi:integrase